MFDASGSAAAVPRASFGSEERDWPRAAEASGEEYNGEVAAMVFRLAIEWFGFETGLFAGKQAKMKLVKLEVVVATIGVVFEFGFGGI